MSEFFPTDVKVRLEGDKEASWALRGAARNILVKALMRQRAQPGLPVQLIQYLPDGGFISVMLIEDQKIITINTIPQPVEPEKEKSETELGNSIYVLCGIETGASTVTVGGKQYLRSYRPSPATAKAHKLPNAYHDNLRLATTQNQTKAGMYSGAMKRVVAAVEGLGKISDTSGQYLTPELATRVVLNKYVSSSTKTHGIYKSGPKNHWLVEISTTNGIIAMPLPLINSTKSKSYLQYLRRIGDTGGLDICLEFGGLPSGETFPTGAALTTAITNGKVIRLMTATDLDPYYKATVGETHSIPFSWAFSNSGGRAVNTRFNYKTIQGDPQPSVSGELWEITVSLSPHDKTKVAPIPVGTGSATLFMHDTGRISMGCMRNFWGSGGTEKLQPVLINFTSLTNIMTLTDNISEALGTYPSTDGWGATIYAFFNGDSLELVKYVPPTLLVNWYTQEIRTTVPPPYVDQRRLDFNTGPWYDVDTSSGAFVSPGGIISTSVDLRKTTITQQPYAGAGHYWITPHAAYISTTKHQVNTIPDPPYTRTLDYPCSSYAFTGVPTSFDFLQSVSPTLLELEMYYIPNTASLDGLENSLIHKGTYSYDGRPNFHAIYYALLPGGTREGAVLVRHRYDAVTGPERDTRIEARGIFDGLGVITIPFDPGTIFLPDYRRPMFFGAVINPGRTKAYVMTKWVGKQADFGSEQLSPGYVYNLVFDGTSPATTDQTTFIGSF